MTKILLVEDEAQLSEYLKPFLERRGLVVFVAAAAQEALDIYAQEDPAIVLLDLGLPDRDGRQLLKEIKSRDPQTKVVIISGYTEASTKKELLLLGADYFLEKPIVPLRLYEFIKEISAKG